MTDPATAERLDAVLTRLRRFWQRPAARAHFDARLDPGLESRDYRTLRVIGERDGCSVSEIAVDLVLDTSTASRLVERVVARGYVRRSVAETDRRRQTLELTEQGEAALSQLADARLSLLRQLTDDWPPEDLARLVELLERLDEASRTATPRRPPNDAPAEEAEEAEEEAREGAEEQAREDTGAAPVDDRDPAEVEADGRD